MVFLGSSCGLPTFFNSFLVVFSYGLAMVFLRFSKLFRWFRNPHVQGHLRRQGAPFGSLPKWSNCEQISLKRLRSGPFEAPAVVARALPREAREFSLVIRGRLSLGGRGDSPRRQSSLSPSLLISLARPPRELPFPQGVDFPQSSRRVPSFLQ